MKEVCTPPQSLLLRDYIKNFNEFVQKFSSYAAVALLFSLFFQKGFFRNRVSRTNNAMTVKTGITCNSFTFFKLHPHVGEPLVSSQLHLYIGNHSDVLCDTEYSVQ